MLKIMASSCMDLAKIMASSCMYHHQPLVQGLCLSGTQDEGIPATERPWSIGVTGMVITALFSLPADEFQCCA